MRIVLGEAGESSASAQSAVPRAAQPRAASRASIKKITINESCILESLEPSSDECGFSRVSVASGVGSLTLRGSAAIGQLVVVSSESRILVGSAEVKIEQAAGEGLDDIKIESEPGKEIDISEIKKFSPLDLSGSQWKIWTDPEYVSGGGKAVINDFDADSITVTANKTPPRYPWDATVYFLHKLEAEGQYLVEFEAKFTGTLEETSFNVYDVSQKKNICVAPFSPTAEWKLYSFMAPINSAGGDAPTYVGDEIEFSFRLAAGTLEVRNFTVYNCWQEDFEHEGLEIWDTWFKADCGASVMLYDVSKDSVKAFRVLDDPDAVVDRWMMNIGYKLGAPGAGEYIFSFHTETKKLKKLNVHIASGENNTELGQASGFSGPGDYYVRFAVPEENSGGSFVMQFWLDAPEKDLMEERFSVLADTLDVSRIKFSSASEADVPAGLTELHYTAEAIYD